MFYQNIWTSLCGDIVSGLKYMHLKGLLHNDLKSNNVLLKKESDNITAKIIDMGKVTLKSEPEEYKLRPEQQERYNIRYTHLAYELRNVYGSRTSYATDIYSLGRIFQFVSESNVFLDRLCKQMLSKNPNERPNILKIAQSFRTLKNER